jgi:membrane protein YqaA with SNARE-associated domain
MIRVVPDVITVMPSRMATGKGSCTTYMLGKVVLRIVIVVHATNNQLVRE